MCHLDLEIDGYLVSITAPEEFERIEWRLTGERIEKITDANHVGQTGH